MCPAELLLQIPLDRQPVQCAHAKPSAAPSAQLLTTGAAASHQYRSRFTTIARARRWMYVCGSWLLAVTSREAQGHRALHAWLRERFSGAHGRREDGIRAEDVNALPVL